MDMEAKQPGQAAYEARWQGIGYAVPWRNLYGPTRERWAAVEAASVEAVKNRATAMVVEAAETSAYLSAAFAGLDSTCTGLREDNARLREIIGGIADTMEAARETLGSRRKFDAGLLASWDRVISEARVAAAPGIAAIGRQADGSVEG